MNAHMVSESEHFAKHRKPYATALLLFAGVLAFGIEAATASPTCVKVSQRVTQSGGGGYNHLVKLQNNCKTTMTCKITTNANKAGVSLTVAAGESKETNTFLNSPAREFTAEVNCKAPE